MRKTASYLAAILLVAMWVPVLGAQTSVPPEVAKQGYADMIVVNGKIVSVDDKGYNTNPGRIYEAMAVKRDRIMKLGTNQEIRVLADANTKVFDLSGYTIIPGIIETHSHMFGASESQQMGIAMPVVNVRVRAARDLETTRLRIEQKIEETVATMQPDQWLNVGVQSNVPEGVNGDRLTAWTVAEDLSPRNRLDRVAPNNPVLVATGVRGSINSKALEAAEMFMPSYGKYIGESLGTEFPDSEEKGLVGTQEMAGIRYEIWSQNAPISLMAQAMRQQHETVAARGITTFSSRIPHPRVLDAFALLNREKQMAIRFAGLYEVHRRPNDPAQIRQFYKLTGNLTGIGNDWFWIHGVASERWDTNFPMICLGPDVEAPPRVKAREMCPAPGQMWYDTLRNAMVAGWRLAGIHGEGSQAIRAFIQMTESVMKEKGLTVQDVRNLRMTMEHTPATGQQKDVLEGLAKYNIFMSASPSHFNDSIALLQDYGPAVMPFLMPLKTMLDNGVRVVGQHANAVGSQFLRFITRENSAGQIILPEEALDRVVVLKMYTTWASEYIMREEELGSLEVGKFADFVVLDKDFFTVPLDQLPEIYPQMTVIGGKPVYAKADFAAKNGMPAVGYQFPADAKPWTGVGGGD